MRKDFRWPGTDTLAGRFRSSQPPHATCSFRHSTECRRQQCAQTCGIFPQPDPSGRPWRRPVAVASDSPRLTSRRLLRGAGGLCRRGRTRCSQSLPLKECLESSCNRGAACRSGTQCSWSLTGWHSPRRSCSRGPSWLWPSAALAEGRKAGTSSLKNEEKLKGGKGQRTGL